MCVLLLCRYLFICSQVEVVPCGEGEAREDASCEDEDLVGISVARAEGGRCARCWNYSASVGSFDSHKDICERCHPVVTALEESKVLA